MLLAAYKYAILLVIIAGKVTEDKNSHALDRSSFEVLHFLIRSVIHQLVY